MAKHSGERLGQHWLFDEAALEGIVAAAEIKADDTVLEVGPGLGGLTSLLCERAREVIAVEADDELAQGLPVRVPANNLRVVTADILEFDLSSLPEDYLIVANLPYYLTSHFLRRVWSSSNPPARAALLLQKEVAERITAAPGAMSVLAFSVQYYASVCLLDTVPKELFDPPPQVDSAIVALTRRPQPYFLAEERHLFRLVKAGFGERRKKLANALAGGLHIDKTQAGRLLQDAGIDTGARAQELSLDQWQRLYVAYHGDIIGSSK